LQPIRRLNISERIIYLKLNKRQETFLFVIGLIAILTAITPAIENIHEIFKNGVSGLSGLGEKYEEINAAAEGNGKYVSYLSSFSGRCMKIQTWFSYFSPILLFLYLCRKNCNALVTIGLLCSAMSIPLFSLAKGQRAFILIYILYLVFLFLVFKKILPPKSKKVFLSVFLLFIALFITVFSFITLSRFGSGTQYDLTGSSVTDELYRYAGESFINFNADAYKMPNALCGSYFLDTYLGYFHNWGYWDKILKIKSNLFYGIVGQTYFDFSIYTLPIFCILSYYVRKVNRYNSISSYINISTWALMVMFGIFGNIFIVGYSFIPPLILSFILKRLGNKTSYKIQTE
jgi:oligosaccharide repeat unit polymerase